MADEKMIITIGREHGTMGEKIAEKIRRKFDLPLYDKAHLLSSSAAFCVRFPRHALPFRAGRAYSLF